MAHDVGEVEVQLGSCLHRKDVSDWQSVPTKSDPAMVLPEMCRVGLDTARNTIHNGMDIVRGNSCIF
jgi:hypothetical protein